jgi:hypothetical protein
MCLVSALHVLELNLLVAKRSNLPLPLIASYYHMLFLHVTAAGTRWCPRTVHPCFTEVINFAGRRAPARPLRRPEDEEADIEAQLERERQEILKNGQVAAAGDAVTLGETLVLKVTCKHGSVQIRQGRGDNFVTLQDKFKKYAMEQQWATRTTKLRLICDDDDINIEENTPDDFDLEDGMIIDVEMK